MEWERYDGRGDKYEDSPRRECDEGSELGDEIETEKSSRHRSSKERRKASSRGEDKDYHRSRERDRDRDQERSKDKRKDDRDQRDKDKDRSKEKIKEKDYDRDRSREKDRERDKDKKDRVKEKERDRDREVDKEKVKEKHRDRDRVREKEKREKHKDQDEEREGDKDRSREKVKEKIREKQKERDAGHRDKVIDRERVDQKAHEIEENDLNMDGVKAEHGEGNVDGVGTKGVRVSHYDEEDPIADIPAGVAQPPASELQERILRMKEERLKKKSEGDSDILAWVNRSRKLEEKKKAEKKKALQLSKVFEEQDILAQEESDDDEAAQPIGHNLAGVKVLDGLDKVAEGGAVVLTLKDQSILTDGNLNEEVDMLENVEIGEQKRRNEAYKAAKKKTDIYDDKFNDISGSEKRILPQYDDPVADEGLTLDAQGRVNSEAEKKLDELRRRLQGPSINNHVEDLTSSLKVSSDYYTQEEMLKFKKPKKKKAFRKKEKLDLDALEAEAVASGLGARDLGSRNDGKMQAKREEQERSEAEKRINAYQTAYAKAEEASKSLHGEQALPNKTEEDESLIIADDDDELYKSLERARKAALKKQREEAVSGPQAIARLASSTLSTQNADDQNPASGEGQERVVFTEMEEFVWGLQLNEDAREPNSEDVFMEEDEAPKETDQEIKNDAGGWTEVKDISEDEHAVAEDKEEVVPDETLVEPAVGKGLSGALRLLKERGSLKETIEWGGRNMDKKKSKLVGIVDNNEKPEKEIRIERTDEFGRILTPKEAFRLLSHKFHGKEPGKMKKEKRMKQYHEDLKLKQMKNSDTPSLSVERMREAQAKMKTPYLVLSGHVKPGQTSDPTSGFATVEKDGGLTPMLGDKKVEHFLGIKRKAEHGNSSGVPKKPKT